MIDRCRTILQYFRVRLSKVFVKEANPAYVLHGTKGFKTPWRHTRRGIKAANKPNFYDWGTEPMDKEGLLHRT
jgi:hypothetical protein